MTEYDYSPEAMDRFLATQDRIARWVDKTKQQPPANPFTPQTPAPHAPQPLPFHDPRSSKHKRSASHGGSRPPPTRSHTAPPRDVYPQHMPINPNSYPQPHHAAPPMHRYDSDKTSRKTSRSSRSHHSSTATLVRPPPVRSQTSYMAPPPTHHLPPRQPMRSNTTPAGYPIPAQTGFIPQMPAPRYRDARVSLFLFSSLFCR